MKKMSGMKFFIIWVGVLLFFGVDGIQAQLFAAIITKNGVLVKTTQGWQDYDGGEVFFYYAYLVNREVLKGDAMHIKISETSGDAEDLTNAILGVVPK